MPAPYPRARNLPIRQNPDVPDLRPDQPPEQVSDGDRIAIGENMPLAGGGLDLGSYLTYLARRQEVVASNIANADTPGYKTRDVEMPGDFTSVFAQFTPMAAEVEGLTTRNDGNNVSMDREARLLAENDIRFNLASQLLRSRIKGIRSAIEEGRSS
jgi:flagellar basal-body rod protein FlgB